LYLELLELEDAEAYLEFYERRLVDVQSYAGGVRQKDFYF
jgi:hypothetical protein